MPPLRFPVAVIMQRVPLTSRWADERWQALAVEPCEDPLPAQSVVSDTADGKSWRCSGQVIELHPAEAEGYYLNVSAREPKGFVQWPMPEPGANADPRRRPSIAPVTTGEGAPFPDRG